MAFLEQEGLLGGATLADANGATVRLRSEAVQIRLHATILFGDGGEFAVQILDNDGRELPLSGLFAVRLEPDSFPSSARARTFADALSGLPTLEINLAEYHPPVFVHIALLTPFDEKLYQGLQSDDPPVLLYRLYPPPTLVTGSPSTASPPKIAQEDLDAAWPSQSVPEMTSSRASSYTPGSPMSTL